MFTGIIEATAEVLSFGGGKISLQRPSAFGDVREGSSIAVAGVCLTVTALSPHALTFDVVPVTLKKTKLSSLRVGSRVNLERAMRASGRFEGHIVLGHCEGTGNVQEVGEELTIEFPGELQRFIVRHGSIAIDGVSLTVAEVARRTLTTALIPHTRKETTLGDLQHGDLVNLETDVLGRYILSLAYGGA